MNDKMIELVIIDTITLENITEEKKQQSFAKRYLEPLDVIDDNGKIVGSAARGLIHRVGLRHKTVYVIIVNGRKQLLLQTRGQGAGSSPRRLDISVGGHVKAGENDLAASAIREMKEELGLITANEGLRLIAEYNRDSPLNVARPYERNRERRTLFEYRLSNKEEESLDSIFKSRITKGEVSGFGWFTDEEVVSAINSSYVADGLMSNYLQWLKSKNVQTQFP